MHEMVRLDMLVSVKQSWTEFYLQTTPREFLLATLVGRKNCSKIKVVETVSDHLQQELDSLIVLLFVPRQDHISSSWRITITLALRLRANNNQPLRYSSFLTHQRHSKIFSIQILRGSESEFAVYLGANIMVREYLEFRSPIMQISLFEKSV